MSLTNSAPGALDGLRIVDLSVGVAGAFCARILAGYGAEVVRVEDEPGTRLRYAYPRVAAADPEGSALAHYLNAAKKSISVDAGDEADRAWLWSAVAAADAVIEDRGSAVLADLGLDVERLRSEVPHMVVTSISPFGATGPHAGRAWDDLTVAARGGLLHTTGAPDREPLTQGGEQTAYQAGSVAAIGTLAAMLRAQQTGAGDHVDCAMIESVAVMVDPNIYWNEVDPNKGGRWASMSRRLGNQSPGAPRGLWPCKDGWVMAIPRLDRTAEALADLTGIEAFRDERFQTLDGAAAHADELSALLISWLMDRTREEAYHAAQAQGHYFGHLATVDELHTLPQLVARDFFRGVQHPAAGALRYPGGPASLSGTPWRVERAPLLDEHAAERETLTQRVSPAPALAAAGSGAGPLTGVRVLDLTRAWAGPLATKFLADLGADVVKVHAIQVANPQWDPTNSAYFRYLDGGKRTIGVDLSHAEGQALIRRLVANADVVVENFSPRVLRKFSLHYEALKEVNPRLVMVSMPGFGSTGPEAGYRALGETIEALSGMMSLTGYRDEDHPTKSGVNYGDPIAGVTAVAAALVCLIRRERGGEGQWVDASHLEATVNWLGEWVVAHSSTGATPVRQGNGHPRRAPRGVYPTSEQDRWVAIAATSDEEWPVLCSVLGLASDPSLTAHERLRQRDELDALIAEQTGRREAHELVDALQGVGVAAEVVSRAVDVLADEQLEARGFWISMTPKNSLVPQYRYNRSPLLFEQAQQRLSVPCGFSEALDEVLVEWGALEAEEVDGLVASGAVSRSPKASERADLRL